VLVAATSTYRIPAVVTNMAKDSNKAAFAYVSRRPGLLVNLIGDVYHVGFEAGGTSQQRRFTFNTPDYVFGALKSVPRSLGSAGYQNSGNRWMGVTFATAADAVVAMFGNGTGGGLGRGYAEIVGDAKHNAMVITKDPSATANIGTRVFVSQSVWNNGMIVQGGWHFLRSGDGYAAFRIANQGISAFNTVLSDSTPKGVLLELEDQWSPVAFQMERASTYNPSICSLPATTPAECDAARYAAFRSAVLANPANFAYDSANKRLTYTSLAGDTYVIYSGQGYTGNLTAYPLPTVNGDASVSPAKTYDSPYISGIHGQDTVTLTYGAHTPLVLDFTY
jgi:hypothetical protein